MSKLICFSGIDGSGKSTLARELAQLMASKGIKAKYVYCRYIPVLLRPAMLIGEFVFLRKDDFCGNYADYSNCKRSASKGHPFLSNIYQIFLLFDYYLQIILKIRLPLFFGNTIICDRYIYDTIATDLSVDFNYTKEDLDKFINLYINIFPQPNLTFLVDVPEEVAFNRKDDVPSIDYLRDRRKIFLYIASKLRFQVLDGSKKIGDLLCEVEKTIGQ
jgi:thymidylate kinase